MSDCEFARLAHKLVIIDKIKHADDVAGQMGVSYDVLYARLAQRVPFRPNEARALIAALEDIRLAGVLLDGTPFMPADRPVESDEKGGALELTHNIVIQAADVLRAVREGLVDNRLDHRDKAKILREASEAEATLASLRVLLECEFG